MLRPQSVAYLVTLCALLLSCGGGVITSVSEPPMPPPGTRPIQLKVTPIDADLWVDGIYRGTIDRYRDGWIAIDQGARTLELRSAGYYRVYRLVTPNMKHLAVKLLKVPSVP